MLTFSQTGNTLKVGNAIGKVFEERGYHVDHVRYLHRKNWKPDDADIIGIGCPCFEYVPAEVIPQFLKEMDFDFTGKKAFVYITSGGGPGKTLYYLAEAVRKTGAEVLGGVQIRGMVSVPTKFAQFVNRPDENDLLIAESFGKAFINKLERGTSLPSDFIIDIKKGGKFFDVIGPCSYKSKVCPYSATGV